MKRSVHASASQLILPPPAQLAVRNDLHLARKAWHMFMGLAAAFTYLSGMATTTALVLLGTLLGVALIVETARLRIPAFNEKVVKIWSPFMRRSEVNRITGVPSYLLSAILAIAIFPRPVAVLSIIFLAIGDPIASLFGIMYGHKSVRFSNGKSLIGTAAGIIACVAVGFVFLKSMQIATVPAMAVAVLGGIAGGTAEHLPIDLDDNFTIPVVSGFVLWLLFIVFGL